MLREIQAATDLTNVGTVGTTLRQLYGLCEGASSMVSVDSGPGHPAAALVWLAETLAARGEAIEPGSIVLSGGLTASVLLRTAGRVTAEFDGLGSVEVACTDGPAA